MTPASHPPEPQTIERWIIADGGCLDFDRCPDCWEKRAHIERYEFACMALFGMRVLDFGCGVGYGTQMLARRNEVTGVDSSKQVLSLARSRSPLVRFEPAARTTESFDACVAFEVIEHLDDPAGFVRTVNARHLIASVPVIPTVGINPHHKHDFTIESFRALLETRFDIKCWWIQVRPFQNFASVAVFHGAER